MKKFIALVFCLLLATTAFGYQTISGEITVTSGTATGSRSFDMNQKVLWVEAKTDNVNHGDSMSVTLTDNYTDYVIFTETDTSITSATAERHIASTNATSCVVTWSDTGTTSDTVAATTGTLSSTGADNGTTFTLTVDGSMTGGDATTMAAVAVSGTSTTTVTPTNYYAVGPTKVTITFGEVQTGDRTIRVKIIGE